MELIRKQNTDNRKDTVGQSSGTREQGIDLCRDSEYDHGGNVYKAARELSIPESKIIDFSASINPIGISDRVKTAITGNLDCIVHYPDPDADDFKNAVSSFHGIDPGSILPGNGSTELIYLLTRALKPESALITSPTFSEYERACKINGDVTIRNYELKEDNFQINADDFIRAMLGCDMAFLCNPNNPTGYSLPGKDVLKIADAAGSARCVLIVDEAFIDFVPEHSVMEQVKDYSHMIVLRSLTKFYALTGLRIGYGVLSKELQDRLKEIKEPWSVNSLAQTAAVAALDDKEYIKETREVIAGEKAYLEKSFRELGITFFPSPVNFYLLHINCAEAIASKLRGKGILVRSCSNFKGLDDSYIRVAVRTRKDNEILLKELAAL